MQASKGGHTQKIQENKATPPIAAVEKLDSRECTISDPSFLSLTYRREGGKRKLGLDISGKGVHGFQGTVDGADTVLNLASRVW